MGMTFSYLRFNGSEFVKCMNRSCVTVLTYTFYVVQQCILRRIATS